jgi:acetylornithine deacetylase
MIEAFLSFKELFSDSLPASLALVVGEEDSGDGVMRLLQSYQYTWAVVAEPTNLKTCLNHYGYLECELRTYGRRRHASYSGETHNAVYSMLNLLLDLRGYFKENNNYIYNIRELHSSDAGFSVPDKCICWLDVHLPANLDLGVLKKEIIFVAQKFKRKNLKARVRLAFPTVHKGYRVSSRAAIVKTIKQAYMQTGVRWHTDKFRSDSDASILNESGVKAVILGPGRLARAHSKKELISAGKIETAANIYLNILQEVNGVG